MGRGGNAESKVGAIQKVSGPVVTARNMAGAAMYEVRPRSGASPPPAPLSRPRASRSATPAPAPARGGRAAAPATLPAYRPPAPALPRPRAPVASRRVALRRGCGGPDLSC